MEYKCSICDNDKNNTLLIAKEMMLGTFENFEYYKCSRCGCAQIKNIPENLQQYYNTDVYYSFQQSQSQRKKNALENLIRKQVFKYRLKRINLIGKIICTYNKNLFSWVIPNTFNFNSSIIDIGSGAGNLLVKMANSGFKNLYGIDPYIEQDIIHECGKVKFKIEKKEVDNIRDKYDLIMMHHSFEHMDNPHKVLEDIKNIMHPNSKILIRIPIIDSYFWRKYGIYWYGFDAPRHLFLYSVNSIYLLAEKHGFNIDTLNFDAVKDSFICSENFQRNIHRYSDKYAPNIIPKKGLRKEIRKLNTLCDSDSVYFYLSLKNISM